MPRAEGEELKGGPCDALGGNTTLAEGSRLDARVAGESASDVLTEPAGLTLGDAEGLGAPVAATVGALPVAVGACGLLAVCCDDPGELIVPVGVAAGLFVTEALEPGERTCVWDGLGLGRGDPLALGVAGWLGVGASDDDVAGLAGSAWLGDCVPPKTCDPLIDTVRLTELEGVAPWLGVQDMLEPADSTWLAV